MQVKDDGTLKLSQGQANTLLKAAALCGVQAKLTDNEKMHAVTDVLELFAASNGPKRENP